MAASRQRERWAGFEAPLRAGASMPREWVHHRVSLEARARAFRRAARASAAPTDVCAAVRERRVCVVSLNECHGRHERDRYFRDVLRCLSSCRASGTSASSGGWPHSLCVTVRCALFLLGGNMVCV